MALAAGTRLGSYEVVAQIGAGGMGEVYQAHDTKLGRDVAIKVLPEAFAHDADRLSRFQREAKMLASLNHPNIATIFGLEQSGATHYLVMELVSGDTLQQRVKRDGPVPIEEALAVAKQIAEALEAAHEKGIIHRDLKPANVKLTPEGKVKVLDFGLAKAFAGDTTNEDIGNSPTLSMAATMQGVILGTAAYMSPEQARGKAVDKRTDIWAFGCVLYELLTGKQAFSGEDITEILAAVVKSEPDWNQLPASTQPAIRVLLRRCLRKDRRQRVSDAADVRIEIEDALSAPATAEPPSFPSKNRGRFAWSVTAITIVGALALTFVHFHGTPPLERTLQYGMAVPENGIVQSFAISPDGHWVTIASTVNGKRQLWLRPLDVLQAQAITGTEDAAYPFWSPDSRYIGFFAQGKLKKLAVSGGPAQSLCRVASGARGGSWSRDDVIVFSLIPGGTIQRVSASGGVPSDVTKGTGTFSFPVFLPDGRHFLYTDIGASREENGIYVSSLNGGENRRVLAELSSVAFAPTFPGRHAGYLLFIREGTLMAQPFDASSLQVTGDALPIAEGVSSGSSSYFAPVTASETGVLLYASSGSSRIVWFDRTGKVLGPEISGVVWEPSISPDEKAIVFRRGAGSTTDIWLRDLARGTEIRLTSDASANLDPVWSPKGDRIMFNSNRNGPFNLYQKAANGSGQDELLLSTPNTKVPDQWSRDGRLIVYSERDPKTNSDLWVLPVSERTADDRKPVPFLRTGSNELYGQISPDGHWMAYSSDETGQPEVYVRPFPAADGKWRVSTSGGEQPRWRGDGRELFFVGADGTMTAVSVKAESGTKPTLEASAPAPLFETHIGEGFGRVAYQYDVTADGKRFLVAENTVTASALPLTVVVNWTAGLKK